MADKPSRAVDVVVEGIRRQIKAGSFHSGTVLPSEQLLASSFGVSRGTVRLAIDRLIKNGTITRRPHSRPIVSWSPGNHKLGNEIYVWVSRPIGDQQTLALIKEISTALRGAAFRLVVREPSRFIGAVVKSDERDFLLSILNNPNVAGAIIERDPFSDNGDVLCQLVERGKHLVFVDTPPPSGVRADFVGTSNVTAARNCTQHLLNLGHSRIYCVSDCVQPPAAIDRIKGFWRAMRQSGADSLGKSIVASELPKVENIDLCPSGQYTRFIKKDLYFADIASRAVNEILSSEVRPTALFVCHDVMAFWVCALLEAKGFSIPKDFSVVGFDWLANWDDSVADILTTASQDFGGFGIHAANLLLDRLSGDSPSEPRHVLLNAPLVVRSSTTSDLIFPPVEAVHLSHERLPR